MLGDVSKYAVNKNANLTTLIIISTHPSIKIYNNQIYKNFNKLLGNCNPLYHVIISEPKFETK